MAKLKLLSSMPPKEYRRIMSRMNLGRMTRHIENDSIYFDEEEYENFKPKRTGRKPIQK